MRFVRVMALVAFGAVVPLAVGFSLGRRGAAHDLDEAERFVEAVKQAYQGCESPEASIVMAELGIYELGKRKQIPDAPERLEKALAKQDDPALRNFTRFLLGLAYAEQKRGDRAADALGAVIDENTAHLAAERGARQ